MSADDLAIDVEQASFRYLDKAENAPAGGEAGSMQETQPHVSDITLRVEPGRCLVLCGGSGEGKSTILRLVDGLAGTFYPGERTGVVKLCGNSVGEMSPEQRTLALGVVMQDPRSQFFADSVRDEIAFAAENLGMPPAEIARKVGRAADICGVDDLLDSKVSQLSSGQKQRVAIAAAIVLEPRVLILDEPTSNLDGPGARDLVKLLAALKEHGVAILASEHRLHALLPIADDYACVHGGKVVARWTAKEFAALSVEECVRYDLRHPDMVRERGIESSVEVDYGSAFELRDVTYRYPSTGRGIENVSIVIPCGKVTVIRGENGAGKTTLARVLCGISREQEGACLRDGKPLSLRDRRRASYFVMQDADYQLYAGSVADEVVLGRKVDDALRERAWNALKTFSLDELAERHPASLSGGQKQRVTLAAAYCSDADLIVLDEPTSGLDARGVCNVAQWTSELAAAGKAVVIITHDELLARMAADRVYELEQEYAMTDAARNKAQQPNAFGKLFYFMRDDKPKMAVSLLLACLGEIVGMIPYLVIALLAARLLEGTLIVQDAVLLAAAAAAAHVIRFFCTWRSSMMSHRIAFKALQNMRDAMAEKMARVPMGTIIDTPTGTFKNRFIDNVNQLEDAIAHFMPELPSNVFGPLLAMVVVFVIDWRMGLAGLATLPLGVLFYLGMMRGYKEKMQRYITSEQKMNSSLVEYVNGIQVIKAYQRTASSYGAFSESVAEYHDSTLAWYRQSWIWMAAIRAVMPCTLLAGVPLGVLFMADGSLTLPAFLACIVIPMGFIGPALKMAQAGSQISRMSICLDVIWDFLQEPELSRPAERVGLQGTSFEFDDVSFAYHKGAEVLHGISFATHPGTVTAIVGPSGSGKSTIAKLMAGFWDATGGTIRFGGADVRQIPFTQLMENISYVSQDTFLFDCSLIENIRLGKPDATDEQVRAAAHAAGCHEFISALPDGYDTGAGEAGECLSGGEKQRIAIARAILKDAPVVILDEATAYADPENEAYVERAISELVRGKTLVTIAHRLSTVKNADCILVVDSGRIVGRGTHEQLLESCPLYARMWSEHIRTIVAHGVSNDSDKGAM